MSDRRLVEIIDSIIPNECLVLTNKPSLTHFKVKLAAAISAEYVRKEDCPKYCEVDMRGCTQMEFNVLRDARIRLKEERKP